jgi:hypothetical protein
VIREHQVVSSSLAKSVDKLLKFFLLLFRMEVGIEKKDLNKISNIVCQ